MVRLVSIDPELLVHPEEQTRRRTWDQVRYNCGWPRGTLLAENPNLLKLISRVPDGTSSKKFQEFIILIRTRKQCMKVPGLEGDSWFTRALSTSLMDYLLTGDGQGFDGEPRVVGIDRYFDQLAGVTDLFPLKDPRFLKTLDLLVIGSSRLDVIDKYQPLYSLNPIFQHWIQTFGPRGALGNHLRGRPILNLHLAHKASDSGRLTIQPSDTALGLLQRMKGTGGYSGEQLTNIFEVHFRLWEPKAFHSRYLIGDIGGLHLGESLNEAGPVTVTHLAEPLGVPWRS